MKNNFDISVVIAGIRPHYWNAVYHSLINACGKYSFELIFVGPFDPPEGLVNEQDVKYIKDFGAVPRAAQIGAYAASGKYIYSTTDDVLFREVSVEKAIEFYETECSKYDVIGMRYREVAAGKLFGNHPIMESHEQYSVYLKNTVISSLTNNIAPLKNEPYTADYWFYPPGEPIAIQILMSLVDFQEVGGWECSFEYLLEPAVDLGRRLRRLGGTIYQSPEEVALAEIILGKAEDHGPIVDSIEIEKQTIANLYINEPDRTLIPFNNWRNSPEVWTRRFPAGKVETHAEMVRHLK